MEVSSEDDQAHQSALQSLSVSSSPLSSLLLAIEIALAFRISQLPKFCPLLPQAPIAAAGLPPLPLPSKTSPGNRRSSRPKSPQQPPSQTETSPTIAHADPQDFSPGADLEQADELPSSRIAARTGGEECSRTEVFSPLGRSVLGPIEDRDAPDRRTKPEIGAVSVDADCHLVSAVPPVDNLFEHAEEEFKIPRKRITEIVSEGNVSEEADGSQSREFPGEWPQESEISFEGSAQQRARGNSGPSLTTGFQLGKSASWSTGYDSEVEDDVGSATGQAISKKSGGSEVLDEEFYTQNDRLRGRRILYPEIDHVEGASVKRVPGEQREHASVYRMPGEQTEQNSSVLSPTQWAVAAFQFQVQLIVQAASWIETFFQWCNSFASDRIEESSQTKGRATEAVSQRVGVISEVGTILVKKAAWGCLAATYIFVLLSMLLLPALFVDFAFVSKILEEPASIRESVHFDYTKPHPTAVVFLRPLPGDGGSRSKLARHRENFKSIPLSHSVHVTVILTLPESHYNRNLGMFQLTAELLSESGRVVKSSSRPCMLRYHSAPIRLAKTVLASLPSLLGIFFESQTLVVNVMEFEEQHVLTGAVRIVLQPKAGMKLGAGIPEIYSAEVHIESVLPWPKEVLRSWKWTFFIWMALMLYILEILMVLCCCRQVLLPKTWFGKTEVANHDRGVGRVIVTSRDTREHVYHEG